MMDRALQERIIGAVVLVVFAVLVVPVFLDGRAMETAYVSQSVTLPGQNNQERRQQTIVLQRDRSEPVPAASAPLPATPKSGGDTADSPPPEARAASAPSEPARAVSEDKAAPKTSSTGMWAVQLGSFSSQDNAERLAADLRKQGYAAFLSQLDTDSGSLHRVRVGPQKDRAGAEDVAAQLAKGGHTGQVVPHP